jgi:hypothetical protein
MRVRNVFASTLLPQILALFSETWNELKALTPSYQQLFIEDERQGRLEDDDNLPYTLDWLVLEELDFIQATLRAPPVMAELESQQKQAEGGVANWISELMHILVSYSQITTEEEGLWNIDVNLFLSEEISTTANYTSRTACGDLIDKVSAWIKVAALDGLLVYCRSFYGSSVSWKANEAALFLLTQIINQFSEADAVLEAEKATAFVDFIQYAIQQPDEFLRARGHLVAGSLIRISNASFGLAFLENTLQSLATDESEVVKVACTRALQFYLETPAVPGVQSMQASVLSALSNYISLQDMNTMVDSDDFLANLVQTIRDAISLDPNVVLTSDALNLLFTIANFGAAMFTVSSIVNETFEDVTTEIAKHGHDAYAQLCSKVLPSLTGAFHISAMTEQNALTNMAADLLAILTEHSLDPLPQGFVGAIMPKLNRILLESNDEELLKSATCAVKNMLSHDPHQLFEWHDESGKGGLEVILVIIDRLLGPSVDDNAGAEVGGLAAELVEKAGSERLGPFLPQLLRAVAVRLASATQAQFIQSLILVFARLSVVSAKEIIDFLGQVDIGNENGLPVVMTKWLENSVNFAGYDEIRQK